MVNWDELRAKQVNTQRDNMACHVLPFCVVLELMGCLLQVEELAKSKLEKPKRLQQQAHREWQEIKHASLQFQRRQQEADALRQLTKADLSTFFQVCPPVRHIT